MSYRIAKWLRHPIVFLILIVTLTVLAVSWVNQRLTAAQDDNVIRYTRALLATRIDADRHSLAMLLRNYALWDEMYRRADAVNQVDLDWLAKSLTASIYRDYHVSIAGIIEPSNRHYAYLLEDGMMRHDKVAPLLQNPAVQQLIDRARQKLPYHTENVGIVYDHQRYWFVAVTPIAPEQPLVRTIPRRLMLMARELDQKYLSRLSTDYLLKQMRVSDTLWSVAHGALPLRSSDSRHIGVLSWRQSLPSDAHHRQFLMILGLSLALLVVGAGTVLWLRRQHEPWSNRRQQQILKQNEALRGLLEAATGGASNNERLTQLCQHISKVLSCDNASIWHVNGNGEQLVCKQRGSANRVAAGVGDTFALDIHPIYAASLQNQSMAVLDASNHEDALRLEMQSRRAQSLLDIGISRQGQLRSVLSVEDRRSRNWHVDEIRFLVSASKVVALLQQEHPPARMVI